ncbi:hypothetical protein AYI69_g5814 [Smittium culicis]|uniref:Reverse transcriptase domain-containing protein n=1 Tax=Smittium culicis TaxID=133412 RepID=A0A1R1Y3D6_9FUNG|nr:hypothetical protein AYI69_g5814 [Smittium culicis]
MPSNYRRVLSIETLETIRKLRKVFKKLAKEFSGDTEYSDLKEKVNQLCSEDPWINRKAEFKKACGLLLDIKSRELWSWLKRFSGRFRSSLVDEPIFDKNRQFITDTEAKAETWVAHFEELKKDSAENSRSNEKLSKIVRNSLNDYTECDAPLTWSEICGVLKATPNNKSPGCEGITSKIWKLIQHEEKPTSQFTKIISRLFNGMWNTDRMPIQMDPSVVGYPASPLPFEIFINDLLEGIKGVKIPGIDEEIPEKLSAWSKKWEMQINQDKCGVIGINSRTGMLFTVMGKPIDQVSNYKYLGKNRENGRKAFNSIQYFFSRKDIPTAMRVSLIRTVLIPILCYSGEIYGMSEARCGTLQKVADEAARLAVGVCHSAALQRLGNELKIEDILTRQPDQLAVQDSVVYEGQQNCPLEEAVPEGSWKQNDYPGTAG